MITRTEGIISILKNLKHASVFSLWGSSQASETQEASFFESAAKIIDEASSYLFHNENSLTFRRDVMEQCQQHLGRV